eukprot:SAG11_NODE_9044_length_949_cov_2.524706_1_plen_152_part_00
MVPLLALLTAALLTTEGSTEALTLARTEPTSLPLYPVYWNVNAWSGYVPEGSPQLPVHLTKFGFMAPNLTATGGGCSLAGCQGCNHTLDCTPYPCPKKYWRGCWQGDMPAIHPDGSLTNGGVPQAADLQQHLAVLREGMLASWAPFAPNGG